MVFILLIFKIKINLKIPLRYDLFFNRFKLRKPVTVLETIIEEQFFIFRFKIFLSFLLHNNCVILWNFWTNLFNNLVLSLTFLVEADILKRSQVSQVSAAFWNIQLAICWGTRKTKPLHITSRYLHYLLICF